MHTGKQKQMNVSYQASLVNRHIRRFTGTDIVSVSVCVPLMCLCLGVPLLCPSVYSDDVLCALYRTVPAWTIAARWHQGVAGCGLWFHLGGPAGHRARWPPPSRCQVPETETDGDRDGIRDGDRDGDRDRIRDGDRRRGNQRRKRKRNQRRRRKLNQRRRRRRRRRRMLTLGDTYIPTCRGM